MRTVRFIGDAEMVALFLTTEYPSPRTHQLILQVLQREGWFSSIIEQPNLHDEQENAPMFLAFECLPVELEVIVGFSEQIENWGCY
jgi:hypothetical protein